MKSRIVSDSMYKHSDHLLKFCILRSIVLIIQKVSRLDFLKVPRGHCGETLLHRQKPLVSFQNEHLFVFYYQQSTQNQKEHFGSMNEAFWTRQLCECRRCEKQVTNCLCIVFFSC